MSNNQKIILGLIVGLVLGYLAGSSWGGQSTDGRSDTTDESTASALKTGGSDETTIKVSDQVAGDTVLVEQIEVTAPTWIALRVDVGGQAGDILGATLLPVAGQHSNVNIQTAIPTAAKTTYHLALYRDDGDQQFDNRSDSLLLDKAGEPVDVTFTTL